jgi:hypothetical protein
MLGNAKLLQTGPVEARDYFVLAAFEDTLIASPRTGRKGPPHSPSTRGGALKPSTVMWPSSHNVQSRSTNARGFSSGTPNSC